MIEPYVLHRGRRVNFYDWRDPLRRPRLEVGSRPAWGVPIERLPPRRSSWLGPFALGVALGFCFGLFSGARGCLVPAPRVLKALVVAQGGTVNDESLKAYPLTWPAGVARTPPSQRRRAAFKTTTREPYASSVNPGATYLRHSSLTIAGALERLIPELDRLGARRVVVSTNVELRQDGLPYSNRRDPVDPGVAVYFELGNDRRCIPCDVWNRVPDNLAGVAAAVEALRGLGRWVNDAHVRAAFRGFAALPDPNRVDWRATFGVRPIDTVDVDWIRAKYRALAAEYHPDRTGDDRAMAQLNVARDAAVDELTRRA